MPFAGVRRPAIGVSLLKSALKNIGISSAIHYFNLKFAERTGLELYDKISEHEYAGRSLIGELIFAAMVFERLSWRRENLEKILRKVFDKRSGEWTERNVKEGLEEIIGLQRFIPSFIEECKSEVLREKTKLVGFTSTFHQNCASLLLAKTIKSEVNVPIIFGGANCEGEMGATILEVAPWVDFVCSGEGDIAFIEFVKAFLRGRHHDHKINGIITRKSNPLDVALTNPVMNMDDLPYPDFDDYFAAYNASPLKNELDPNLLIETSRGCWWGEISHCTFCGLNGSTMKYRSKSIVHVLHELQYLVNEYGKTRFQVVDNILDLKYIDQLFPKICDIGQKVDLFYETKSNLSKDQLLLMKKGGVNQIQPGIESLSDIILRIMKKGVSALHNIQVLKWC